MPLADDGLGDGVPSGRGSGPFGDTNPPSVSLSFFFLLPFPSLSLPFWAFIPSSNPPSETYNKKGSNSRPIADLTQPIHVGHAPRSSSKPASVTSHSSHDKPIFPGTVQKARQAMKTSLQCRAWPGSLLLIAWLHAAVYECQITVPVFLPGYGQGDWEVLRGSIVASVSMDGLFILLSRPPRAMLVFFS